jgi:hypothetical protein
VEELLKNNLGLQVLTDQGWSKFDGLLIRGNKQTVRVNTKNRTIRCTQDHKFFLPDLTFIEADKLLPGMEILSDTGIDIITCVVLDDQLPVYDLFEVEKNHRFYANGFLVKNCEFLIYDETLINSSTLIEMSGIDPIERQGNVRWYKKPEKGNTYLVALDPSLGTGGDPSAIQVFELPNFKQVAEWQHNKTSIQRQILILKEICQYLYDSIGRESDIYYSIENNSLGEAGLVSIAEIGEENIRGMFMSEPVKVGQTRRYRKGFTTTHKSKLAACAKLKSFIENKKMIVSSKNLISELKSFVSNGGTSFAAKPGETDDLVMATLLIVRMVQFLQNYDESLDNILRDKSDDFIEPMPFILM